MKAAFHWKHKYPPIAAAVAALPASRAYLEGELCAYAPSAPRWHYLVQHHLQAASDPAMRLGEFAALANGASEPNSSFPRSEGSCE